MVEAHASPPHARGQNPQRYVHIRIKILRKTYGTLLLETSPQDERRLPHYDGRRALRMREGFHVMMADEPTELVDLAWEFYPYYR